jgi:hypothetical protein
MHLQQSTADAAAAFAGFARERRGIEFAIDLGDAVEVCAGAEGSEQRGRSKLAQR